MSKKCLNECYRNILLFDTLDTLFIFFLMLLKYKKLYSNKNFRCLQHKIIGQKECNIYIFLLTKLIQKMQTRLLYYVILLLTHAERNRSSLSSIVNVYFIYLRTNKILPKDEFYMLALRI